eukprot:CAMPEP_0204533058 /NCGR_PEP_ID=MMETSP0661-20131031/12067_1 /ASSEMBLY_ACC=CAM_ASM_000606 /TAXON_ID=109239 /ORGANISM="Alexandrium margalefi, Strain AMGDE01CS-322" /LENGTH=415 /DNA_ID=CAMNT_0051539357 /DNA_START=72 /DNA_END=1316 /DNA_ORIENTATION=-
MMLLHWLLLALLDGSVAVTLSLQMTPRELTVKMMRKDPSYATQLGGCAILSVDSSDKAAQDEAAREGVIEVVVEAMNLFPEDKALVSLCTMTMSTVVLFNRDNGLRAGRLGAVNRTLHVYMQNMDDPQVMALGGAIGAYFDYVDENRLIAGELGGIQAIIQNIKNHFHGKYGAWSYVPVRESLYALSSGCWVNQDICYKEGFPELAVKLMNEHGHEAKIAEETQQVTKALMFKSELYRDRLADLGITDSMVHVLQVRPQDRGAMDLTCENLAWLVGPQRMFSPTAVVVGGKGTPVLRGFNGTIQSMALKSQALGAVVSVVKSGEKMRHFSHGSFNFDIDLAYNVNRDCFSALAHLSHGSPAAQEELRKAGMGGFVLADLAKHPKDPYEVVAGCSLLKELNATGQKAALALGGNSS